MPDDAYWCPVCLAHHCVPSMVTFHLEHDPQTLPSADLPRG